MSKYTPESYPVKRRNQHRLGESQNWIIVDCLCDGLVDSTESSLRAFRKTRAPDIGLSNRSA
jgi:hypothetical protein